MQAYLEAHGALPGGWDNATFRTQSNVYAWTLLRNTGRTNLTQAEFRALADDEWTQIWAQQGNAALDDVYKRECGWVCRNKNWITPVATTTAAIGVSVLTGGAAATWAAGAGYSTITTGAIAGGAGGLGGSLTAQTITGNYSLKQTLIDTAIGTLTGGIAGKLTTAASQAPPQALEAGQGVNQWQGDTLSRVTQSDETFYRVWGGGTKAQGEWLTPIRPGSAVTARQGLSLPPGNAAEYVSEVTVPAGTRIQVGSAGAAFGSPGGWPQARLLDRLPLDAFSKGVPLG
jgi:hypothetical protein